LDGPGEIGLGIVHISRAGAVLAAYNDEWTITRRHMSIGVSESAQVTPGADAQATEAEPLQVEQLAA